MIERELHVLIGALGVSPEDGDLLISGDPCIAVARVYQVEVLGLVVAILDTSVILLDRVNQRGSGGQCSLSSMMLSNSRDTSPFLTATSLSLMV